MSDLLLDHLLLDSGQSKNTYDRFQRDYELFQDRTGPKKSSLYVVVKTYTKMNKGENIDGTNSASATATPPSASPTPHWMTRKIFNIQVHHKLHLNSHTMYDSCTDRLESKKAHLHKTQLSSETVKKIHQSTKRKKQP